MENLTTTQAAKALDVHPKTVLNWIHMGLLPAHRTSQTGRWRIRWDDLVEYAEDNEIPMMENGK